MRPRTACSRCRDRKRRCVIVDEDNVCRRCKVMRLECDITEKETTASTPDQSEGESVLSPIHTHPSNVEEDLPPQSVCNELVDLYFDYLHDKQHSLFHRPSFISDQRKGGAPKVLVAAIIALSARLSSNIYFRDTEPHLRGRPWAEYAKNLFHSRLEALSLTAVQACCILSSICFVDEDTVNESLYEAQAIRMVQLLDLPNNLSSNWVQRETEIRVWWTIWMMDKWASVGAKLPIQLVADPSYHLPMDEITFETLDPTSIFVASVDPVGDAIQRARNGLWAQMVPLTEMMSQIGSINERTVRGLLSQPQIIENVEVMGNKLDSWLLRLPPELQITPDNLQRFADVGHGSTLVALHLGFHHHAQVLYYQFLPEIAGNPADTVQRVKYAMRCKEHASELSALLWLASSTPGCEALWAVTGHLLVIASCVHLHTLLFTDGEVQISNAKTMLKQNFEMMLHLQRYWPSLGLSISRLHAFQRACRQSMHTSFAMDHWMLLFLQRYMSPIGERNMSNFMANGFGSSEWPATVQDFGSEADTILLYDTEIEATGSEILEGFL